MYKLTVTQSHPQYLWTLQELHRKTMMSKEREANQYCSVNNSAIVGIMIFPSKQNKLLKFFLFWIPSTELIAWDSLSIS